MKNTVTQQNIDKIDVKLTCPFCGGKVCIVVCDDEGNIHNDEYEKDPWSGLGYMLIHKETDVPETKECPIATEDALGNIIYETREEAINIWNDRVQLSGKTRKLKSVDITGREWLNSLSDEEFVNYLVKQKDGICVSDTNKEYTKRCYKMDNNCRKCMLEFLKSNYSKKSNS